jgi:hypothetical protein
VIRNTASRPSTPHEAPLDVPFQGERTDSPSERLSGPLEQIGMIAVPLAEFHTQADTSVRVEVRPTNIRGGALE